MNWTEEQQSVIDVREQDVLVSAAAGSGKTAVLVARILALVTDPERPMDIDRLLIVTFTNAAAAEMRQRIRDALEKRAEEEPDNEHLQRQLVLIHNAKITTIHSFCLQVLRNHFHTIGLDPSFRVADEGEVQLLEQDVLKEVLEQAYEEIGDHPEFSEFLEQFSTGRDDRAVSEAVLALYHYSLGQPWPLEWLEECRKLYERKDGYPDWLDRAVSETKLILDEIEEQLSQAAEIAREPDGPYPYLPAIEDDLEMIGRLQGAVTYEGLAEAFYASGSYTRLSTKKDPAISEEKKQLVKAIRDQTKNSLAEIRAQYFYDRPETLMEEFWKSGLTVRELTRLTERFIEKLKEKKAEKNLLDFSDLEHRALEILTVRDENGTHPSPAAAEYAESFEEIMIDEYQDSNLVQEILLNSVAGAGRGKYNRFMVGDVKQSIYRFRLARPELFLEKQRTYGEQEGQNCRIDLHNNFRSRRQVLNSVNYIFRQIMTENPGGVLYDEEAALYAGAQFEPLPAGYDEDEYHTELLLLEPQDQEKREAEARLVGQRIRELVGRMPVWDPKLPSEETGERTGGYRPAQYRDIVILLRTVSGWAETFSKVLGDMGIPCFTGSRSGYFSATEVRTVLSYLEVLDNPIQDIPLAAVLRSPIGGLMDEELARIRSASDASCFYDCCREYASYAEKLQDGSEDGRKKISDSEQWKAAEKLQRFFRMTDRFREKAAYTPVHDLLEEILEVTGYGSYAAALPGGRQRRANLDMLTEKAMTYEAASYRGLYHFVRYIENLKQYEIDFGEAGIGAEAADTVRIMSIHKSKGLEFPVVFVSGMAKKFNETDLRSRLVMHPELGLGCDYVDSSLRIRQPNLLKKMIQSTLSSENLGEELRVLYVAMTRAKEKLILTGCLSDTEQQMEKWNRVAQTEETELPYSARIGASSYLDWIIPALLRHPDADPLIEAAYLPVDTERYDPDLAGEIYDADFDIRVYREADLEQTELRSASELRERLEQVRALNPETDGNTAAGKYLDMVFDAVYPYEADRSISAKMTVSELKRRSMEETDQDSPQDGVQLYVPEPAEALIPQFLQEKQEIKGASRGTLYHLFMENYDFSKKDNPETQLEELVRCGKMSRGEASAIRLNDIRRFLGSGIGRRMERAALEGRLHREQPFVLGVPANTIQDGWSDRETVLIQGIIDAWFVEDGSIVVVDFKTDRVSSMEQLGNRYRLQLDYYAQALEQLTGFGVKERMIYSFCLGKELVLEHR